jgi:hypothetical protein
MSQVPIPSLGNGCFLCGGATARPHYFALCYAVVFEPICATCYHLPSCEWRSPVAWKEVDSAAHVPTEAGWALFYVAPVPGIH